MRGVVKTEIGSDIQFEGFTGMLGSTSAISSRWPTRSSRCASLWICRLMACLEMTLCWGWNLLLRRFSGRRWLFCFHLCEAQLYMCGRNRGFAQMVTLTHQQTSLVLQCSFIYLLVFQDKIFTLKSRAVFILQLSKHNHNVFHVVRKTELWWKCLLSASY